MMLHVFSLYYYHYLVTPNPDKFSVLSPYMVVVLPAPLWPRKEVICPS